MAGSLTNTAETDFLELLFTNLDWPNIGDAAGLQNSAAAGSFYIALYTVAPTDAAGGTECAYTGYARVAVARSAGGWTVAGANCSNAAAITFGENTGTSETGVAMAILTAATGGDMIAWADLDANITIDNGTIPEIPIGDLDINMD